MGQRSADLHEFPGDGLGEVLITDVAESGEGIGRIDGLTVFVRGLLPGDRALVKITDMKKRLAFAEVVSVLEPSAYRISEACEFFGNCGGCGLMGLGYEAQLRLKERWIRDRLERIGGIKDPKVIPMEGMLSNTWHYRGKAGFAVDLKSGKVGFCKEYSHDIADVPDCLLQSPSARVVAEVLRKHMADANKRRRWPISGLTVRTGFVTGEVMVVIELADQEVRSASDFNELIFDMDDNLEGLQLPGMPPKALSAGELGFEAEELRSGEFVSYSLESVYLRTRTGKQGQLREKYVKAAGKDTILEEIGGLMFEISPESFFQVNHRQADVLAGKVREYAALTGRETVLDLYCGVGSLGLLCAAGAKRVVGIESVKQAVINANRNAVINRIVNAEFVWGRAEEKLQELPGGGMKADVIILDPPRAGCRKELLEQAAAAGAARIIYVSCYPAALARDVRILTDLGYELREAAPVDMFPHTLHVECCALLVKKE